MFTFLPFWSWFPFSFVTFTSYSLVAGFVWIGGSAFGLSIVAPVVFACMIVSFAADMLELWAISTLARLCATFTATVKNS